MPFASLPPFSPCGAPLPGSRPIVAEGYTGGSPFDGASVLATVCAALLAIAIVAGVALHRRNGRGLLGSRRRLWLACASILFAGLSVAWIWQLRNSYLGGCAISFNAAPFTQSQAMGLAPLFAALICALTLVWIISAVWTLRHAAAR